MSKKTSNYPVTGFDYPWGNNKETGEQPGTEDKLPHSGEQIRQFLGEKFNNVERRIDKLENAIVEDSFDLGFSNMPIGDVVINGTKPYYFKMFIRSTITLSDGTIQDYDKFVTLEIIAIRNGKLINSVIGTVEANKTIEVNITPYLVNNDIFHFRVTNQDDAVRNSTQYRVIMANMGLDIRDNSWWTIPYVKDTTWYIPLSINVNIPASLKVTVTEENGIIRSTNTIPSSQLSENYNLSFVHPIVNGGPSGIYNVKIELNSNDPNTPELRAVPLEYKICCLSSSDTNNYIIKNNVNNVLENYKSNRVFDYATCIGYGNPTVRFVAKIEGITISDTGNMPAISTIQSYILSLDQERTDTNDFDVEIETYLDEEFIDSTFYVFSNSEGYAAIPDAKTFIKFNGRSNIEDSHEKFINLIDNKEILPEFINVNWTGADGYIDEVQSDNSIRTKFRLLAGSKMILPLTPLKMKTDDGCTIEIIYKANNVRNFDTHIIECQDNDGNGFYITPSEVAMQAPSAKKHDDQNTGTDYEDIIHAIIVIRPQPTIGALTVDNFNACMIYLNGCRNRWFSYNKDINVDSPITFGSEDSDIDIYAIRIYNKVLSEKEIEQNTCNMKAVENEKKTFKNHNDVRENGKVDFNKVRVNHNCIVFDTPNIPTRSWSKDMKTEANIEIYIVDQTPIMYHVSDFTWQGTTSHNYGIDDRFGGYGQNYKWTTPDGEKDCAKANWASSMQSHKIGMTAAYTDLAITCGVISEGQRISINQTPMVGFHRKADGSLVYIGLFTVGPDKGNKPTFGLTSNSLRMEGSDNEPLGTNFLCPWNADTVSVDSNNEKYSLMGVTSWEDSTKKPAFINSIWVPAYNFVFGCSQEIEGWQWGIAGLRTSNTINKSKCYWLSEVKDNNEVIYQLYYYNSKLDEWKDTGINLKDQLCDKGYNLTSSQLDTLSTIIEKNNAFKAARKVKFKKEVENYFNKLFFLYHSCFIEFFACTDNLSKNTYPVVFDCTEEHPLIGWIQDDLDSVGPTENRGGNYKKYCVEVTDNYKEYGRDDLMVFNGTKNQFWLLVRECYANELETFMREKFLPSLKYGQATDSINAFQQWFKHYFFDNAQNHFCEALYNECGRLRYGYGHLSTGNENENAYQYQGIALSQDSGNAYLAEKYWFRMRFIYMSSKYTYGLFAAGNTDDTFATRPYSSDRGNTFEITPAIYMYPSVQNGQSVIKGIRIYPGVETKSWSVTLPFTAGDQEQRINGMSYIASLGPIYNAAILGNININGRMLTELQVGTLTDLANIRSRITGLGVGTATSLKNLTLANINTLQGVVDVVKCFNLRKLYAEGTKITSINLSDGGPLNTLHLPITVTNLKLEGKKSLTDLSFAGIINLTNFEVSKCNEYTIKKSLNILTELYMSEIEKLYKYGVGIWTVDNKFYPNIESWEIDKKPEALGVAFIENNKPFCIDKNITEIQYGVIVTNIINPAPETIKTIKTQDTPFYGKNFYSLSVYGNNYATEHGWYDIIKSIGGTLGNEFTSSGQYYSVASAPKRWFYYKPNTLGYTYDTNGPSNKCQFRKIFEINI